MTNEEIIKGLESVKKECGKHLDESFAWICEPIDGAIKALEQQPSDDCVSRQAVLKGYIEIERADGVEVYSDRVIPKEYVEALPPVTPTHSWIPIITREPTEEEKKDYFEQNGEELCYMIDSPMPDNGQEVLVSVGSLVSEDIFCEDSWDFENWDIADVEAWMPLPKPFEEKRGSKDDSN